MTSIAPMKSVVIIGAGFGGVGMAIRLKQAGIDDVVVLERASGPGGVWQANRYPGAACDVESHLYSFSFATNFDWAGALGTREEILAYFNHCIDHFGIADRIRYNQDVRTAAYDEASGLWSVALACGEVITARAVVSACGLFNTPSIPEFQGAESFAGAAFHSAEWKADFDPRGRRIAVIGTGCSAAQFVPAIVDDAQTITVFQRTPAFINPRGPRPFTPLQRWAFRTFPALRKIDRYRIYSDLEKKFALQLNPEAQAKRLEASRAFVAREIQDPEKRAKLLPTTQAGCKRNVNSSLFVKVLNRDDVHVVTEPIRRIHPQGVETADGRIHEVDAIIYGTGFTASDYLSTVDFRGVDGQSLHEAWRDGAEAYLGISVSGFPNLFLIYGPNTNSPGSIVFMIECQIQYIVQAIGMILRESIRRFEVQAAVQAIYNAGLQQTLRSTSWASGCTSYFMNKAGRIVTQFPGKASRYAALTRRLKTQDYIRKS